MNACEWMARVAIGGFEPLIAGFLASTAGATSTQHAVETRAEAAALRRAEKRRALEKARQNNPSRIAAREAYRRRQRALDGRFR